MKQMVKLNEQQLRKMIAESVQNVLTELDWKTASKAADIQSKWEYNGRKGGNERYFKFRNYSDDAANLKFFGQQGGVDFLPDDSASYPNWVGFRNGYPKVVVYNSKTWVGNIMPTCAWSHGRDPFGTVCIFDKDCGEGSTMAHPITPNEIKDVFGNETELYQRFMDAVQEYTDFKQYKYTYDNEKGWHLKESVLKRIVSESIQKVLGK